MATVPLWMALGDWLRPRGVRPSARTALGLALGFGGVVVLIGPSNLIGRGTDAVSLAGVVAIMLGCMAWSGGSLYARSAELPRSPLLATGMEMLAGGVLMTLVGLARSEHVGLTAAAFTPRALAALARSIGFALWVVDELEEFASEGRFPGAQLVHGFDVPSWAQALPLGPRTSVLIATRDHAVDQQLLEALIGRELGWLGVIGSRGKAGRFRRRLEARGVAAERIARVRMPVGLDIGAETPEEIAVSIAAELIQVRHAGQPRSGDGPAEVEVENENENEK